MTDLLAVRDLTTVFETRHGTVRAVNGVSFGIGAGELVGLVGESGCGKSVTALSLMRLLPQPPARISGGPILYQGRDVLALNGAELRRLRGREIAMVFQDPLTSLNPIMRLDRQMAAPLRVHLGLDRTAALERALELLRMVGIPAPEARLRNYPHQLSGGMRQRVVIAMALSCRPSLLLADEPTTALDVTIQAQILELLRDLARETGTAVLLITHDLGVVAGMCERVMVMYAGHIVEEATRHDLFHRPRHPYTVGLLQSVPRLDRPRQETLSQIEGTPPDMARLPPGCPFQARCAHAQEVCHQVMPPLISVAPGHMVACHLSSQLPVASSQLQVDGSAPSVSRRS